MTLTHNVTLDWADAALDSARHDGLTEFGREVVREMNRLGMLVDLSHVSPAMMSDALDVAEAPVIFSHSSARRSPITPRNVPDSILARLPKNGGVVMVTFVPAFVSPEVAAWEAQAKEQENAIREAVSDTVEQTRASRSGRQRTPAPERHPRSRWPTTSSTCARWPAVDHVGIGSDFDGIDTVPVGLEDVSKFPDLFAELIRRGWSDARPEEAGRPERPAGAACRRVNRGTASEARDRRRPRRSRTWTAKNTT